jgi:hypothetical protein
MNRTAGFWVPALSENMLPPHAEYILNSWYPPIRGQPKTQMTTVWMFAVETSDLVFTNCSLRYYEHFLIVHIYIYILCVCGCVCVCVCLQHVKWGKFAHQNIASASHHFSINPCLQSSWFSTDGHISNMIADFRRVVDGICALLGEMGPIGCPANSARNYQSTLRDNAEECRSHVSTYSATD